MDASPKNLAITRSGYWSIRIIIVTGLILVCWVLAIELPTMRSQPGGSLMALVAASSVNVSKAASLVDINWHAPNSTVINDLSQVMAGSGVFGFVYNSSTVAKESYETDNWCNMPHVRSSEYNQPSSEFELQYVEVVGQL